MRRLVARPILAAGLTLLALAPNRGAAQAAPDSAKRTLALEILQVTKVTQTIVGAIEAGLPAQRAATPQLPKEFWDKFAKYAREGVDSLALMLVPVYTETFSEQELRDLLAFYRTPLGLRMIAAQPQIMQRSTLIGQQWGTQLGFRVAMEIQDPTKPPPR